MSRRSSRQRAGADRDEIGDPDLSDSDQDEEEGSKQRSNISNKRRRSALYDDDDDDDDSNDGASEDEVPARRPKKGESKGVPRKADLIPKRKKADKSAGPSLLLGMAPMPRPQERSLTPPNPKSPPRTNSRGPPKSVAMPDSKPISAVAKSDTVEVSVLGVRQRPEPKKAVAAPSAPAQRSTAQATVAELTQRRILNELEAASMKLGEDPDFQVSQGTVDMFGSFLQTEETRYDFYDTNDNGEIVFQPRGPVFPEDFSPGMKEHPLSWWGIVDPLVGAGKYPPVNQASSTSAAPKDRKPPPGNGRGANQYEPNSSGSQQGARGRGPEFQGGGKGAPPGWRQGEGPPPPSGWNGRGRSGGQASQPPRDNSGRRPGRR